MFQAFGALFRRQMSHGRRAIRDALAWLYSLRCVSGGRLMADFDRKLSQLVSDLITQGDRVVDMVLRAVESYFEVDTAKAGDVISDDLVIDRVDVEIERASIPLLAMGQTDEYKIRSVLMIVKVNNELERIADSAVNMAEVVLDGLSADFRPPDRFRVMANSVIGMLRDANRALAGLDVGLAERVLSFDDAVDQFKREIFLNAEQAVAAKEFDVKFAFRLRTVTAALERIADHCTNICEQIIYLQSGCVVRHSPEGWTKPHEPKLAG